MGAGGDTIGDNRSTGSPTKETFGVEGEGLVGGTSSGLITMFWGELGTTLLIIG